MRFQYEGETFVYDELPRKDAIRFVGLRPLAIGRVRVLTFYKSEVITVTTKRTHPKITKQLYAMREFGGFI